MYTIILSIFEPKRKISKKRFVLETIITVIFGAILTLPHLFFNKYSILSIIYDIALILVICNITSLFLSIPEKTNMKFENYQVAANIIICILYIIFCRQGNLLLDVLATIIFNSLSIRRYASYLSNRNYQRIAMLHDETEAKIKSEYNGKKESLLAEYTETNKLIERNREYCKSYAKTKKQKKKINIQLMNITLGNIDDAEKKFNYKCSTYIYFNNFCKDNDVLKYQYKTDSFIKAMMAAIEEMELYISMLRVIGKILETEKKYINLLAEPLQKELSEPIRQKLIEEFHNHINGDRNNYQIKGDYRIQLRQNILITEER